MRLLEIEPMAETINNLQGDSWFHTDDIFCKIVRRAQGNMDIMDRKPQVHMLNNYEQVSFS